MPSRWARRISPYWNTVSILCLRFQNCPGDGPYWNGSGWGGSRLDADFSVGGGSLLRADYHLPPETRKRPSAENATAQTPCVCPSNRCNSLPNSASQRETV